MVSPTGAIPLNRCTNQIDTNPFRARPEGMPVTDFLIEIGRQQNSISQNVGIVLDVSDEELVQAALLLGDISEVGATKLSKKEKFVNAISCTKQVKCYPIYQFAGGTAFNPLRFTLDSRFAEPADTSVPPRVSHTQGKVHKGMKAVLWGGHCYDHPCLGDALGDYEDLLRGMQARYSGRSSRCSRL
ncbi:MAG: hypothetical protein ACRCWB_01605 [Enterovibrio sp.]